MIARGLVATMVVAIALGLAEGAAAEPRITMRWTGGLGGGLSANVQPHTIARGPDDAMWFTEATDPGGVARATEGVNELRAASTPGLTPNARPHRIALGPDGVMWMSMAADPGRLVRIGFPPATFTTYTGGVTPGFSANGTPADLVTGSDGNLWMLQTGNPGRVDRVTPAGAFTELTGGVTPGFSANSLPAGIDAGPDGRLWFTEAAGNRIGRIDPATLSVNELGGLPAGLNPQDIVTGPDGAMWVTAAGAPGRILRITTDDKVTEFTGGVTPGLSVGGSPTGIAAGPDGNLWFVKTANPGMVVRITPDGEVTEFRGGLAPGLPVNGFPISIAAGYDGAMWFTLATNPGYIGHITVGPGAITGAASNIGSTSARAQGFVRPNGQETTYRFEYGRTTAYGSRTDALGADDGLASRAIAQTISGLQPRTLYHYRLVAVNGSDTTRGGDRTFTTGAPGQAGKGDGGGNGLTGPRLTRLHLSRTTFKAWSSGSSVGPLHPKRKRAGSTIVSFRLAAKATVRFTALKCLNKRCTKTRSAGSFSRSFKAGSQRFRFTGRVKGKRLAAGRYRLVAAPRGDVARRAAFRIVR